MCKYFRIISIGILIFFNIASWIATVIFVWLERRKRGRETEVVDTRINSTEDQQTAEQKRKGIKSPLVERPGQTQPIEHPPPAPELAQEAGFVPPRKTKTNESLNLNVSFLILDVQSIIYTFQSGPAAAGQHPNQQLKYVDDAGKSFFIGVGVGGVKAAPNP